MIKRMFLLCLAFMLVMQGAVSAKKNAGLPEEERIKIAVEITDGTRHKELETAQNLEFFLSEKLLEKNLLNIVDTKVFDEEKKSDSNLIPDEDIINEEFSFAENLGEILVFDAVELPAATNTPKDFDKDLYQELGAAYVVRCEVLALGATKVDDNTIGAITGIIGSGLSFAGSGSKDRDKTLRRVGTGIGALGLIGFLDATKRTALNTVVNMQFISVETGQILWQDHFTGQAIKHHKPSKGYDNEWDQAYFESVENSAKLIAKRVNKYVDQVIIKGKSDKKFLPKNIPFGGIGGGKFLR